MADDSATDEAPRRELRAKVWLVFAACFGGLAAITAIAFILQSDRPWRHHGPGSFVAPLGVVVIACLGQAEWWVRKPVYEIDRRGFAIHAWPWKPAFSASWDELTWHSVDPARMSIHVSLGNGRARRCPLRLLRHRDREWLISQFNAHVVRNR